MSTQIVKTFRSQLWARFKYFVFIYIDCEYSRIFISTINSIVSYNKNYKFLNN